MKKRVLVIDDDEKNLSLLEEVLSTHFQVDTCSDPEIGLARAISSVPDVALIDIEMPKMTGFEVCEGIRASANAQNMILFMLTSDGKASSMQEALHLGANDYLVKPFKPSELIQRIESRLGQARSEIALKLGNLTLDPQISSAVITGPRKKIKRVRLTEQAFRMLQVLIRNEGRILSRDQILEQAWNQEDVSDRAIDLHVYRLRRILSAWNYSIETFYGRGYCVTKKEKRRPQSTKEVDAVENNAEQDQLT